MRRVALLCALLVGGLHGAAAAAGGQLGLGSQKATPGDDSGPGYVGSTTYESREESTTIDVDGGTIVVKWVSWRRLGTTSAGADCTLTRWALEEDVNYNGNAAFLYAEALGVWADYLSALERARFVAMNDARDEAYDASLAAADDPTSPEAIAEAEAAGDAAARARGDDPEFDPPPACPWESVLDSSVALLASKVFEESLIPPAPHIAPDGTAITGLPAYLETRRPVTQTQTHDLAMPIGTVRVDVTGTLQWWVDWDHAGTDDPATFDFGAGTTAGPHAIDGAAWDEAAPDPDRHVWHTYQSSERDVTVAVLDRWTVFADAPSIGASASATLDDHLTLYDLDLKQGQVVRTD